MAQLDAFFKLMKESRASDLHLSAGLQPMVRIDGELQRVKHPVLDNDALLALLREIAPEKKMLEFEKDGDADFSYESAGVGRLRANYFRQDRGVAAVFRRIPETVPTLEELGAPELFKKLVMLPKGLVLVTGPTGSGKSTTLAAMLHYANSMRKDHVVTIEDPIEYLHKPINCLINQREIGRDSHDFKAALRAALREDPDIILVGEMRDAKTVALALEAAETGHLVFSTLHTLSAVKSVDRIIEVFPGDQQAQVRASLSESLRAVIAQTLLRKRDGKGRVGCYEILLATSAVRNLIRDSKTHQIPALMEAGKRFGMQTLDEALQALLDQGVISAQDAWTKASNKNKFRQFLDAQPDDLLDF